MTIALREARKVKRAAQGWLNRVRRAYVRRWYPFTPSDFLSALRRIGVRRGDTLMVHSSFDRFHGFTGKPTDVIRALQEAVGPAGTLLMPTMPFIGVATGDLWEGRVFDVLHSPSRMGLLTELFRRSPGVVRSVHPTHPVAAWGAKAEVMVAGHHLARTPCGLETPFGRLLEHDGRILLLGTGIGALTFCHAVEEILESEMPFSPFTTEWFSLRSRDKDGTILISTTRLFDPEYAPRRNWGKLIPILKDRGAWREERVGRLEAVLLNARDVLDAFRILARRGIYCYDT